MSSMRNAVTRRPHKERSQPQSRERWGILEKHKDYSLRAQDYNLKKRKIEQLSQKARDRNPDEFAFGMLSAEKAQQGQHGRSGDQNRLSHDVVKLLKSQDAGYLKTIVGRGRREIETLEEAVSLEKAMTQSNDIGKKIVFVDGELPRGKKRKASGEALAEVPSISTIDVPNHGTQVVDGNDSKDENGTTLEPDSKKAIGAVRNAITDLLPDKRRRKRLAELRAMKLEALRKRQREIMVAADRLELQRSQMARSYGGVNKNGVKFKIRERKK